MEESQAIQTRQLDANAMRATLAIRIDPDRIEASPGDRYQGEAYGPLASDRTTLPASYRIAEFRAGDESRVVILEPCFWSPDDPFEYEISLTPVADPSKILRTRIRLHPRNEST